MSRMSATQSDETVRPLATEWRRRSERSVSTLLIARLEHQGSADQPCRIRNVSATGMMIEFRLTLAQGEAVSVELRNGDRLDGSVVWTEGGRAGIQLHAPVDVATILVPANRPVAVRGKIPRAPRFATRSRVRVSNGSQGFNAMLLDVSQSGGHLQLDPAHPIADCSVITIPGLPPRPFTVRWQGEGEVGIAFGTMIPYAELADWLANDGKRFSCH